MRSKTYTFNGKKYKMDNQGFLISPSDWDEDFAEGMARRAKIVGGLTEEHWRVIRFIRNTFEKMNECPLVYVACRENRIGLGELKRLFPAGYLRGACKLAGVTYREVKFQQHWLEENIARHKKAYEARKYSTDEHGFLTDSSDWDENFALRTAYELGMREYLTDEHWKVISYLREFFRKTGEVPTVFQTCEENGLALTDLERLFPDGYHRGAVKIAGLRVR
jgi:tRNA 2-thiouridine synthesizing protein E